MSKLLVTCGPWQPLIGYQIFTWIDHTRGRRYGAARYGGSWEAETKMVKFDEQSICGFTSSNYFSCSMVK